MKRVRRIAIACGLLATITSTLSVYPHQLAYFNELAGGPENGHRHLLGSNLDFGQDLLYLNGLLDGRRDIREFSSAVVSSFYEPSHLGLRVRCKSFEPRGHSLPLKLVSRYCLAEIPPGQIHAMSINNSVQRNIVPVRLERPYSVVILAAPELTE